VAPSLKNTASILPEILFTQRFTMFSRKQYDVITDPICTTEKRQYRSLKRKKIPKKKNAILPHFERPVK